MSNLNELKGTWSNDLGSIMNITDVNEATRQFSGTYQTADSIPNDDGQRIPFENKWPVSGFISSDILVFVVDYTDDVDASMASFTGHIITSDEGTQIHAQWILASSTLPRKNGEETALWASLRLGSNRFIKNGEK